MPVTWDTDTEHRLLICCIDPASKPNWETVARDMGNDFTAEACRQRFGKIRKGALENSTAVASAASPSPTKRSRAKKDQGDGSPTKKTKKNAKVETPAKKEGGVKEETNGTDDKVEEKNSKLEDIDTA